MDLWLIILLSAVGGLLLLVFLILTICMCCRRKKRRLAAQKHHKGQNGKVWQAHDHIIEISDDETSPNVDGLCKDTISGSTFPRYKKEKDDHKEDGLCEETKLRSAPQRGNLEGAFLDQERKSRSASESALQTALPLGALAVNGTQVEHGFRRDLLPNGTIPNGGSHLHKTEVAYSSSFEGSDRETKKRSKSMRYSKEPLQRKRSKSYGEEEIPEYTKPIKRAISNPSIVAREKMVKNDKRFQSLNAWKCSIPIPEADYPHGGLPALPSTGPKHEKVARLPSFSAPSDSGVECIDSLSRDGESETHSSASVPDSPGIPLPAQVPKPDIERGSFLAKELRTIQTDNDGQTVPFPTHEERNFNDDKNVTIITEYGNTESNQIQYPPALPTGAPSFQEKPNELKNPAIGFSNVNPDISYVQQHNTKVVTEMKNTTNSWTSNDQPAIGIIRGPPTFQEKTNDWKNPAATYTNIHPDNSYQQQHNTNVVTTTKNTTSSWTSDEQPSVDFRNVKLNHLTTPLTSSHDDTIPRQDEIPEQKSTIVQDDARRVMPSMLMSDQQYSKPVHHHTLSHGQANIPQTYNTTTTPSANYSATTTTHQSTANHGPLAPSYITTQTEYTKKTYEIPGNVIPTGSTPYTTTKTQSTSYKKTDTKMNNQLDSDSKNQVDFRAFKLRPTPESIKQHFGFRQELNSTTQTPEDATEVNKRINEAQPNGDIKIPTSDQSVTKTFGFHSQQSNDKPSHNTYGQTQQTTYSHQPQKAYGSQHINQDTGMKVFNMPAQSNGVVKQGFSVPAHTNGVQKQGFSVPAHTNGVQKQGVSNKQHTSMNGTAVKSHSTTTSPGFRLSEEKTVPGKAVPASEPVVMRPKKDQGMPIDPDERKKNWKREKMEQRLSTTLVMNERQPIMQASGLALKPVLGELFTKIKQIGDKNEDTDVTISR